jgi:hypothetical protein
MPSIHQQAQRIYLRYKDDEAAIAGYREKLDAALKSIGDSNSSFQLTSSTTNGQSFSGTHGRSIDQETEILARAVEMFDKGYLITTRTRPIF